MIIGSEKDVTEAVLKEYERIKNPRLREIMAALVRHLHEFAREVKLTEEEFQAAIAYIIALGKHTNETHNEAVLMSGSLGFSTLICLLNNGNRGQTETDANLLGPFWRMDSPPTKNGDSIVRSPTPGPALFVDAWFRDAKRQADRRRRGRRLAFVDRRILRKPGSGPGRHEPARQVHHRQGRPHRFPQREAGRLSDPDRRSGRRAVARRGPAQYAPGASALPRLQAGLQDADLANLRSRGQEHRNRRAIRRHPAFDRQLHPPRRSRARERRT